MVAATIVPDTEGVNKLSFYHNRLLFTLYHSAFLHSKTLLTFSPRGNLAGIILITLVPGCFHILGSLTRIAMPTINTVSIVRYNNYHPLLPPLLSNLDIFTQYGSVQVSHQHFFFHLRPTPLWYQNTLLLLYPKYPPP